VCYVRKGLSAKDWDGFVENFGIPYTFIIMPPQTSERERAAYEDTVRRIAADGRGVLPQGSEIKTADSGNRGTNPFREHLDYQDEQIVLAATGGLLTMLSQPTGIGSGASQAHADTFSQIARALALEVSEIFQAQLDADILKKLFPSQKPLAYFELCSGDTHDVKNIFENAVLARNAGYAVDPAQLQEKTGYKLLSNEK